LVGNDVIMVRNIQPHGDFLRSLASISGKPHKRKLMIASATPGQIRALQEISLNVAKRTVPLTKCQTKNILKGKYKKNILEVARKHGKTESNRKIFLQRGGFLQYILPAALMYLKNWI